MAFPITAKGSWSASALDILIGDRDGQPRQPDDMLRLFNDEIRARGRFYNESEDLRAAAEEVIRSKAPAVNPESKRFFCALRFREPMEIPFDDLLGRAGLVAEGPGQRHAAFGFAIRREGNAPPSVGALELGSAAQQAGVQDGDILLALNGERLQRSPTLARATI